MNDNEFVEKWNASSSILEFIEANGYTYKSASSRASRLRSSGVNIKSFITPGHYQRIGAIGGKLGTTGGFYANRELARTAGARGGRISRRTVKQK